MKSRILLSFFILTLFSSCANREVTIRNSLATSQLVYNEVVEEVENREAGLTDAQLRKLAELTQTWGEAHNTAVDLAQLYLQTKDKEVYDKVMTAIAEADEIAMQIKRLVDSLEVLQ